MIEIGVDIGGTFTDLVLLRGHNRIFKTKVPTTPADPIVGVRQGIEKILAVAGAKPGDVTCVIHGSTVAINALLQRKGSLMGVLMTDGFEDTLEIGRQKRSRMYELALEPETPVFLAPRRRRFGIPGRLPPTARRSRRSTKPPCGAPPASWSSATPSPRSPSVIYFRSAIRPTNSARAT